MDQSPAFMGMGYCESRNDTTRVEADCILGRTIVVAGCCVLSKNIGGLGEYIQ